MENVTLPDGYVSPQELKASYVSKDNVTSTIQKRVDRAKRDARTALAEDDEFVREIMQKHGVPMSEDGTVDIPDGAVSGQELQERIRGQVELARQGWVKKDLDPLVKERDALSQGITSLRQKIMFSEIVEAARQAGVKDEMFRTLPGAPLSSAPVIQQTLHNFGFDPETNTVALRNGQDYEFSTEKNPERPYAGPREFFDRLRENPDIASFWFNQKEARSTSLGNTDASGGGRKLTPEERARELEQMQQRTYAHY